MVYYNLFFSRRVDSRRIFSNTIPVSRQTDPAPVDRPSISSTISQALSCVGGLEVMPLALLYNPCFCLAVVKLCQDEQ